MYANIFKNRLFIGVLVFALLLVIGCGLYYGRKVTTQAPVKIYKPVEIEPPLLPKPPPPGETAESGHWHGDEWHVEPHETEPAAVAAPPPAEAQPTPLQSTPDFVNPTSTSSNPLFADGVPEHLQCPPELIGVYLNEDKDNIIRKVMPISEELMEKWNPNRPIAGLWDPMIAADKWYRENADPEKAEMMVGGGRIDWLMQQYLDFPEIAILLGEDAPRASDMLRVDIGLFWPDWNAFEIPYGSGRIFRMDYDKRYEFTWSNYTEKENGYTSNTFTHKTGLSGENGELVKINLDEVSDEDLERLGGWNFNINPYTTGAYKLGDKK